MKTILITDIEYKEVEYRPVYEIAHYDNKKMVPVDNYSIFDDTYRKEYVRMDRFFDSNGKEIVIGMSKKVKDVLQLPMDVYADQNEKIMEYNIKINDLQKWIKHCDDSRNNLHIENKRLQSIIDNSLFNKIKRYIKGLFNERTS